MAKPDRFGPNPPMKRKRVPKDNIPIRGFFRLQLVEDEPDGVVKVVGDSGWHENTVTNDGKRLFLSYRLANSAGGLFISRMMLGTGTAPDVTHNTLDGELNTATYTRTTVTASSVGSTAMEFTAAFNSGNSHILAATTLRNIGLINDTTSAGSLFAGNTYVTSQWNTNQSVNASYRITFT